MTFKSFIITVIVIAVIIGSITMYMRYDPNDSLPSNELDFTSGFGNYPAFEVEYKDSNTVKIMGHSKFDIFEVHSHYNLSDIDRAFVYRQIKAVCQSNLMKVTSEEFKYTSPNVRGKIIYDLNRIGIDVDTLSFE